MAFTDVLGVRVNAVDPAGAREAIGRAIEQGRGGYVCVTGVHGIMESRSDPALKSIHNASLLTVPDGMPLVWLSHRVGASWVRRVYGPDLMLTVLETAARRGWSSYLYGGAAGVPDALATRLIEMFPGLDVVGIHSPPFRPLTLEEDSHVVEEIRAAAPDLLWVGLSTPKQERWMAEHEDRLPGIVMLGVGAAFDFHTGRVRQAPPWVQHAGLEWLFRLAVEPRRLWRRYLRNNPAFLLAVVRRRPRLVE